MTDMVTLELAHAMPGRIRLRCRGEAPPDRLVTTFRKHPGVADVRVRLESRTILIQSDPAVTVNDIRELAGALGVSISDPPVPEPVFKPKMRRPNIGKQDDVLQDIEAGLLIVFLIIWIRDMLVNRVFRLVTILLIVITLVDLYRVWLGRQAARQSAYADDVESAGA